MFAGILRVACGSSFGLKSRMTLIACRQSQIGQFTTKSSIEQNVEIDEQLKDFSSDVGNESMNEIDGFIRSYSSSIGVDGIIQLSSIQRKILRTQMKSEMKRELKRQMNLVDVKTKYKNEIDYIKWSFAEVSQRFLLEIFFLRVIEELSHRDLINSTSFTMEYFPNCFNSKGKKLFNPSKSAIENLLRRDSSVWQFIRSSIGIKCDLPKQMNNMLLYGDLSEKIHLPRLYSLYLPSDMPPDNTEFFLELSRIFDCEAETIDVCSATSYVYRDDKKDS